MKIKHTTNYYNVLGLTKDATKEEIKIVYKKLAVLHHPDKGGDVDLFAEIAEAYRVLTNDEHRLKYDTESMFGAKYDEVSDLYNFSFNQNTSYNELNNNINKFKKDELIDILIKIKRDKFKNDIEYTRKAVCSKCDATGKDIHAKSKCFACIGNGVNTKGEVCFICEGDGYISNHDDCDVCFGTGVYKGVQCHFCKGLGKIYANNCSTCMGKKVVQITDSVHINIDDFVDDKLLIRNKGNYSDIDTSVVGNLFLMIVD